MADQKPKVKVWDAEDVNYWETGNSAPDTLIDNAEAEIQSLGGKIIERIYGRVSAQGQQEKQEGYLLVFDLPNYEGGRDTYRVSWPVLRTRTKKLASARRQAATALYYDVKTRVVAAKFMGVRTAFFAYLMMPDGRTLGEMNSQELWKQMPRTMLQPYHNPPVLLIPDTTPEVKS